jgi:hypothetical protein
LVTSTIGVGDGPRRGQPICIKLNSENLLVEGHTKNMRLHTARVELKRKGR